MSLSFLKIKNKNMKRIILLFSILFYGIISTAQDQENDGSDTTRIKLGKSTLIFVNGVDDSKKYDFDMSECDSLDDEDALDGTMYFDIGMNGYMAPNQSFNLPTSQNLMEVDYAKSRSFGFTLALDNADIIKDRLYISPGIGLTWNNYHFKNNVNISTSNDSTVFNADTILDYDKFKLRATYLQIPIVVGVRLGNLKNPIGIQAGVVGGLRIGSMVKQKYTFENADYKNKVKDNFNLSPFKVDLIARLTFGDTGIFASYSMTSLFENDKAPELYPFSAGITIGGFK